MAKPVTVGIDVGYTDLKLVKIDQISDNKAELLDLMEMPFGSDISRDSPEFPQFLKAALTEFCGSLKNIQTWCVASSANVEMRYLTIPKVPKKQIPNAVYWTFKKDISIDETEQIFDFAILGEITDGGVDKIEVMAYTAPRKDISELEDIFSKGGLPLTGITIVPFTFQNLLRTNWLKAEEDAVCNLYIGRGWSRIDIFSKGHLVLSRGIKAGVQSMIDTLREELNSQKPEIELEIFDSDGSAVSENIEMSKEIDADQARKIFFGIIEDSTKPETPEDTLDLRAETGLGISAEEMFDFCSPAVERLARQVEKTLEHFTHNYAMERVGRIYVSGMLSMDQRVVNQIGDFLDLPRETVDPLIPLAPSTVEADIPEYASDRSIYAPAVGLALSSNERTPNFILTYGGKEEQTRINLISRLVVSASLILLALCMFFSLWQGSQVTEMRYELTRVQQDLDQFSPNLTEGFLGDMVAKLQDQRKTLKSHSTKYLGLSILSELSHLTPRHIQLLSLSADLLKPRTGKKKIGAEPDARKENTLILEAIIQGDSSAFETALAGYLLRLKDSMIFDKPSITERSVDFFEGKPVLRFTAQLKLV